MTVRSTSSDIVDLDRAQSYSDAVRILGGLRESGLITLFNSSKLAGDRQVTPVELKMKTGISGDIAQKLGMTGGQDMDRLAAGLGGVTLAAMMSGIAASELLPGPTIVRFVAVWLLCFSPFFYLLYGLQLPGAMQLTLTQVQRTLFPEYRRRLLVHEAAHFLCGYICGLPIEGYSANAAVNAVQLWPLEGANRREEVLRVLGVTNPAAVIKASQENDASAENRNPKTWAERALAERDALWTPDGDLSGLRARMRTQRPSSSSLIRVDTDTLDRIAVVSMAGAIAEVLEFGSAEGGLADLAQLREMLALAARQRSGGSQVSSAQWVQERDARVRWACVAASTILQNHQASLEAVVDAMDRGDSVGECVRALEACADATEAEANYSTTKWKPRQRQRPESSRGRVGIFDALLPKRDEGEDTNSGPLVREDDVLPLAAASTSTIIYLCFIAHVF